MDDSEEAKLDALLARRFRGTRRRRPFSPLSPRKAVTDNLRHERLIRWAEQEWQTRYDDRPFMTIWSSPDCANRIAHDRVKPDRRLRGKARYRGVEQIACPEIASISEIDHTSRKATLGATSGAFVFHFETEENDPFDVLLVCAYVDEETRDMIAVALAPPDRLQAWSGFENICADAVRPRIRRRREVYIVGGADAFFTPEVEWDDVILPQALKDDLLNDMNAFFEEGVHIYRQLQLIPFRKLLLVGVPGTGKTMLCAALSKLAIGQGRVVVYVSGSDMYGATFEKIHRALYVVSEAKQEVLLIVEEIDAYLHADDKARVLNVLDGVESPNNPRGVLMVATTNYPEIIDERIAKRPGRVDRIFAIPPIQDEDQALRMLRRYMGDQWREEHAVVVPRLVNRPGAFVREVALHARMLAAHERETEVALRFLKTSVETLSRQIEAGADFLPRRPVGFVQDSNSNHRRLRRRLVPDEMFDTDPW
ncbi:MAG: ATP-binding protein [Anaerolineae bacterium]|nr:ATP-binding protein [Anaerolineae bacterium]